MPTIHDFGAFELNIYPMDHWPPHYHVVGPDMQFKATIEDDEVIGGEAPRKILKIVKSWTGIRENRELLTSEWVRLQGVR